MKLTSSIRSFIAFSMLAFCTLAVQAEDKITEDSIKQLIKTTDTALKAKDAKALVNTMAADVAIKATYPTSDGEKSMDLTRQSYEEYLTKSYEKLTEYKNEREGLKTTVAPDGKTGSFSCKLTETFVTSDGTFKAVSEVKGKLKLDDGKTVISALDIKVLSIGQ